MQDMLETPAAECAAEAPASLALRSGRLVRALILTSAMGVAVYILLTAWAGWHDVAGRLEAFAWWTAVVAAGLAGANYLLRFVRWDMYLRRLGVSVPRRRSLEIFLSGFAFTVTPGKIGEVVKSYFLREAHGVPVARSSPVLIAERVSDLLGVLILALVALGEIGIARRFLWFGAAFVAALVAVVSSERFGGWTIGLCARVAVTKNIASKLREFLSSTRSLHRPQTLATATAISTMAWGCECLAFWLIVRGFPGSAASPKACAFVYAIATLAGGLSFLPGGLGVQEGGMVALLVGAAHVVDRPTALAATFITRAVTLWFAVVVGLAALSFVRNRMPGLMLDGLVSTDVGKDAR